MKKNLIRIFKATLFLFAGSFLIGVLLSGFDAAVSMAPALISHSLFFGIIYAFVMDGREEDNKKIKLLAKAIASNSKLIDMSIKHPEATKKKLLEKEDTDRKCKCKECKCNKKSEQ